MKFHLIDSIVELDRGRKIVAIKAVSLAEEYLADHFPTFPVLPGVLMLQAMIESAAWLVRDALDFAPSVILPKEAKNVTYKSFVKPGNLLRLEVTCRRLAPDDSDFDGVGYCRQDEAVRGKFSLKHWRLTDDSAMPGGVHDRIVNDAKARFKLLLPKS